MKKILFILTLLAFSKSAFAISNQELAATCLEAGKEKVSARAKSWGCHINLNAIEIQDIDNRFFNPSKYVWYQVASQCNGYDRVIVLVQYYNGQCL